MWIFFCHLLLLSILISTVCYCYWLVSIVCYWYWRISTVCYCYQNSYLLSVIDIGTCIYCLLLLLDLLSTLIYCYLLLVMSRLSSDRSLPAISRLHQISWGNPSLARFKYFNESKVCSILDISFLENLTNVRLVLYGFIKYAGFPKKTQI